MGSLEAETFSVNECLDLMFWKKKISKHTIMASSWQKYHYQNKYATGHWTATMLFHYFRQQILLVGPRQRIRVISLSLE